MRLAGENSSTCKRSKCLSCVQLVMRVPNSRSGQPLRNWRFSKQNYLPKFDECRPSVKPVELASIAGSASLAASRLLHVMHGNSEAQYTQTSEHKIIIRAKWGWNRLATRQLE